jgi:hypothetical protein
LPPAPVQVPALEPARFQAPTAPPIAYRRGADEGRGEFQIQPEPPGLERLTTLDTEDELYERIRQETLGRDPNERITFPEEPILSRQVYRGRGTLWPLRQVIAEPNYTCYGRLYYEDRNSERYGWDLGILQPVVSMGEFYANLALVPYRFGKDPFRCYDCNTGLCLPGDPVPYLLYPPDITLTGAVSEAAVVLALVAIFP